MPRGIAKQQICIVIADSNNARSCGHICQQQAPRHGRAKPWRHGDRRHTYTTSRAMQNGERNGRCIKQPVIRQWSRVHTRAICHYRRERKLEGWLLRVSSSERWSRLTAQAFPSEKESRDVVIICCGRGLGSDLTDAQRLLLISIGDGLYNSGRIGHVKLI